MATEPLDGELAQRAREIFREALEHEPEEWDAFLDRACDGEELRREVASLLEYDLKEPEEFPRGSPIRGLAAGSAAEEAAEPVGGDPSPGSRIGPWRILSRLGRGGMGTVHLVERADGAFEQRAALKLIRPDVWSGDVRRRFESERQILADLRHPNIARLLDGGYAADGRPYLVMELVDGRPIDRYCDEERLSVDRRLELFGQVCRAVEHAHRALIVHRDLKPSNVVVDDAGRVTLLDFGIARALTPGGAPAGPLTRTVARVMTPDYASPEQVVGRAVTTATDVYQLGLLLFELLTGHRAQRVEDLAPGAFERAVCETPASRPSAIVASDPDPEPARARRATPASLSRRLRGDLDSIVAVALRKEPERRYGSVARLHEDVDRHLRGLPVSARPDGLGYRLRRFAGRHRQAVVWGVLCLALAGWLVIASVREAERVRQIEAVIEALFDFPPVTAPGRPPETTDFLDHAAALIRRDLRDQPASQARLLTRLGRTYAALGAYRESVETFAEALTLAGPRGDPGERADLLHRLGTSRHYLGRFAAAEAAFRAAAGLRGEIYGGDDPRTVAVELDLADLLHSLGRLREAEKVIEPAIVSLRATGDTGEHVELRVRAHAYLANVLRDRGVHDRAEAAYRASIAGLLDLPEPRATLAASNRIHLARLLVIRGRLDDAEEQLEEALTGLREAHFGGHPLNATALRELAFAALERGRLELAGDRLARSLEISREWLDAEHPTIPRITALKAELERRRGRPAEAVAVARSTLDHFARLGLPGHPSAIDTCITLGVAGRELGGPAEPWALARLGDCLAAAERELMAGDPRTRRLRELHREAAAASSAPR